MKLIKKSVATLLSSSIVVAGPAFADNTQVIFRYNPAVVKVQALSVAPMTIPDLYVGETFSASAKASGGIGDVTWSHTGSLPPGVSFTPSGVLSGRPTSAGSFSGISFIATDTTGTQTSFNGVTIPVYSQLTGGDLHDVLGLDETQTLAIPATGGKGPLTFTLASGSLPSGMSISGSSVSGTPNVADVYEGTIRVADVNGRTANVDVNLSVFSILSASASFGDAYVGEAYSGRFRATGGSKDYTWTVDGNVPTGLTLSDTTGFLTGTISQAGNYAFTGHLTDGFEFKSANGSIAAFDLPNMVSKTFDDPYVGAAYSGSAPIVSGGKSPLTYTASGLPAGLSINPGTGALSGNPTTAGSNTATITATDPNGKADSQTFSFSTRGALVIAAKTYASPYVGTAYTATEGAPPSVTGGKNPYSWAASGLPAGLSMNALTGIISGTATSATATTATITASDANNKSISRTYAFAPRGALALAAKTYADPYLGTAYSATDGAAPTASGGLAPYTWSATGLPAGLTMNASTGVISGTPTSATATTATITVADSNSKSISRTYSFAPRAALALAAKTYADPYVATAYSATEGAVPTISGGLAPYTWVATGLPAGLSMNATTGIISGTPTSTAAATATVTATDANGKPISRTYAFTPRATLTATNNMPATVKMTAAVNETMAGGGGKTPYTFSATGLPNGLSINASTGAVTGTPTATGTFTTVITVTDANNKAKTASKSVVSEAGVITATLSGGNGTVALNSLFSSTDWTSSTPKVVNLASGQIRGTTTGADAVTIGSAWGGTLTFNVAGEIQGKAGAAGTSTTGGAGGNALNVNFAGASGQKLLLNVTGAIRAGGGGGGKAGAGGAGGNGSTSSTSSSAATYVAGKTMGTLSTNLGPSPSTPMPAQFTITWNGTGVASTSWVAPMNASPGIALQQSLTGSDGATYTVGSMVSNNIYYSVIRTATTTTTITGGAGGAGGNGGAGQGYTVAAASGVAGSNGTAVTNAGTGGKGGTGGAGGAWGVAGSTGGTGSAGTNKTTNGAAGKAGSAGGAAGSAIVGNANVTRSGSGTISGGVK